MFNVENAFLNTKDNQSQEETASDAANFIKYGT